MPELLCVAAIVLTVRLSLRRFGDVFTPMAIYVTIWCSAILLFLVRIINYIQIKDETAMLIAGSIVAYVLGCLVCPEPAQRPGRRDTVSQEVLDRALKFLIAIQFMAFLVFVYRMGTQFGLATYLTDPSAIRREADQWMKMGILGIPLFLHYPILILSFYSRLRTHRWRWFMVAGMTIPFVQELLWTGRGTFALFGVTLLSMWIYFHGWRRINRRLVITTLLIVVIGISGFLVLGTVYGKVISEDLGVYNMADFNVSSSTMLLLAYPYMYVTAPLATFQEAMADVHYYSNGTRTFYPAARMSMALGLVHDLPEWTSFDFYFVPVPNNTYTHLFTFYQDFGEPGVIALPFLLGLFHTYLYWQMRMNPSVWSTAAAAISIGTVCFSVLICLTSTLLIWEAYAVLYLVWRYACATSHVNAAVDIAIGGRGSVASA